MILLLETLQNQIKEAAAKGSSLEETKSKIDIAEMEKNHTRRSATPAIF